MIKEKLQYKGSYIPYLTNDSKSKNLLLYVHGLDGSAAFSKPLFKNLDCKIVAIEQRGHDNSPLPASRMIYKHLEDYEFVIKRFKAQGYKIWVLGESMGAAYATLMAYKTEGLIEAVFAQSIPNKLANIMVASKWTQFKVQFMTTLSFLTNINYKYNASVNYSELSNNKVLHRLARMADKSKKRQVRETLATWAVTKRAWRYIKHREAKTPLHYFQPTNDVIVNIDKAKKSLSKAKGADIILIKDAKHILMYEPQFDQVIKYIKETMRKND